jgi:hypothetical protein
MPLVRVRILHGKTLLAAPSRPFAADATLLCNATRLVLGLVLGRT